MIGGFIEAIDKIISSSLIRCSTPYYSQIVGHSGQDVLVNIVSENSQLMRRFKNRLF